MSPLERYQAHLARAEIVADPAQRAAVEQLQILYDELLMRQSRPGPGVVGRLLRRILGHAGPQQPVRGLYFWGGVGRGKTFLMDIFFESLPFERKMRTHFHRFMRRVHEELRRLGGHKNPLEEVAAVLASEATVICFDEFFVADITDAMILAGLLDQLFARGVTLVTTSNIVPDDLYRDGLQRARFLPAIELLKRHLKVVNVDGGVDYRLRALEQAELYHSPLDEQADASLMQGFRSLAPEEGRPDQILRVANRDIAVRWLADDVAWFEFSAICDGPRSQNDYIELAMEFHAVLISNVPCFDNIDDQARRFINLVDEFYDRNVKLVLSAAEPLDRLYRAGRLGFEFERTRSRLLEMRSRDYLAREHRP